MNGLWNQNWFSATEFIQHADLKEIIEEMREACVSWKISWYFKSLISNYSFLLQKK